MQSEAEFLIEEVNDTFDRTLFASFRCVFSMISVPRTIFRLELAVDSYNCTQRATRMRQFGKVNVSLLGFQRTEERFCVKLGIKLKLIKKCLGH